MARPVIQASMSSTAATSMPLESPASMDQVVMSPTRAASPPTSSRLIDEGAGIIRPGTKRARPTEPARAKREKLSFFTGLRREPGRDVLVGSGLLPARVAIDGRLSQCPTLGTVNGQGCTYGEVSLPMVTEIWQESGDKLSPLGHGVAQWSRVYVEHSKTR